ncbi:C40 family peptidase [Neorhizobium petrolearium]|uniref:NlpC/P60 family protein n=1 Tax=Neorhizobium petrolearium TaxID=515361 RepID=A0ABY8M1E3_9HYPH|nr:NlpC/P60 family protein [Neorhizobium petrolearium]MCC2613298.1 NlpC/P60 family protein [Neorhizobium petrolearium]WGI68385.1 NlpC/P60 family protein [Neorhizobium petrolearium]
MMEILDRRLHAFRPDLADETLKGSVEAANFVRGEPARIAAPVAQLRPGPDLARGIDTELLFGETVRVFDRAGGFAWVQADQDRYVGYLPETMLGTPEEPTHRIAVQRTFLYPGPELRKPPTATLSMGSRITVVGDVETRGTRYFVLSTGGAVIARHCLPVAETMGDDYVAVAEKFIETPYLWGGRSGFGLDCSALVQLSLMMVGKSAPRDSDMQVSIGSAITREELRRGDLVFWKGHVGIMENEQTLLHANGHTVSVAREGFEEAVKRIGWLYEQPTGYRRLG